MKRRRPSKPSTRRLLFLTTIAGLISPCFKSVWKGPALRCGCWIGIRNKLVSQQWFGLRFENLLHRPVENLGDLECQRQTGIILFGLNGIDRLPRYSEFVGEIGLRPVELAPQIAHAVFHWYLRQAMPRPRHQSMISRGVTQVTSA